MAPTTSLFDTVRDDSSFHSCSTLCLGHYEYYEYEDHHEMEEKGEEDYKTAETRDYDPYMAVWGEEDEEDPWVRNRRLNSRRRRERIRARRNLFV